MLTVNKPYFGADNVRFMVAAIDGEEADIFFPASGRMERMPIVRVEEMKAGSLRRTYTARGETRMVLEVYQPGEYTDHTQEDGLVYEYVNEPMGEIFHVKEADWDNWLAE